MMITKKNQQEGRTSVLKIVEAAIIVAAVFAADIALGRIIDVALDAFN